MPRSTFARRLALAFSVLAVGAASPAPVLSEPAAAVTVTQGITGAIERPDGFHGGAVVVVPISDPSQERWYYLENDARFNISLPAGEYWVQFISGYGFVREWWGDAPTRSTSTPVVVADGEVVELDPFLERGGVISGSLAEALPTAAARENALVEVYATDPTYPDGRVLLSLSGVEADGSYEADEIPTGEFHVRFKTRGPSPLEGWWVDETTTAATEAETVPVSVTAPATTSGISPTGLRPQGVVSGVLTWGGGRRLSGGWVSLFGTTETGGWTQRGHDGTVDAHGRFTIAAPSGSYRVMVAGTTAPEVAPTFWGGSSTVAGGSTLTVDIGKTTVLNIDREPVSVIRLTRSRVLGRRMVGETLRIERGTWYPGAATVGYQWLRDGIPIRGATGRTYKLRPADVEHSIRARVTIRARGYRTFVEEAGSYVGVARVPLRILARPTVRGALTVGTLLRATPPRTAPASTPRYQWLRNGYRIGGATGSTYRLRRADRENFISVAIRTTSTGYVPISWETNRRGPVR